MPRIMGVTKARTEFTEVVNGADAHGEPVYLVNFNEPKAVLIGYQAWEALMRRLEDLEDTLSIYRGREEPTRPLEDFLAELEQEEVTTPRAMVASEG